jgi:uncharacterized membrane protein YkvA (DUF1232 family)
MNIKTVPARKAIRLFKPEILILYYALRDGRTPFYAKLPALFALLYLLSPIDLIPDIIPIAGYLDDLIIVPLLLQVSVWLLPAQVKADSMAMALKNARKLRLIAVLGVITIALLLVWVFFIAKHMFAALKGAY